jgi:hypothetical protein
MERTLQEDILGYRDTEQWIVKRCTGRADCEARQLHDNMVAFVQRLTQTRFWFSRRHVWSKVVQSVTLYAERSSSKDFVVNIQQTVALGSGR